MNVHTGLRAGASFASPGGSQQMLGNLLNQMGCQNSSLTRPTVS